MQDLCPFRIIHRFGVGLLYILVFLSVCQADQVPQYQADFKVLPDIISNMTTARQLNRAIFNPTLYSRVREVWFGDLSWGAKAPDQASITRWFTGEGDDKAKFDKICYNEFNPAIEALSPSRFPVKEVSDADLTAPFTTEIHQVGGEDGAEKTKTALSLLILLDQIPRNLYRTNDTLPLVYKHYDRIAVALARHIMSTKPRLDLHQSIRASVPYRQWFYLPLMHSEKIEDHRILQSILGEVKEELKDDGDAKGALENFDKFEAMHADIIEKFGRYPHRSECLGREKTEEEKEFMKDGGATFGVAG